MLPDDLTCARYTQTEPICWVVHSISIPLSLEQIQEALLHQYTLSPFCLSVRNGCYHGDWVRHIVQSFIFVNL